LNKVGDKVQHCLKKSKPLTASYSYYLFIYLRKAYDSVPLNELWETLDKSAINTRVIEAIKSYFKESSSKIKIGNLITKT
jgi:hypothetical protein